MTDQTQARALVQAHVTEISNRSGIDIAIDDGATQDEGWCWLFFYNSRAYLETGSFSHALAGNGPFVVEKETGQVHKLVTGRTIEEQLKELRNAIAGDGD